MPSLFRTKSAPFGDPASHPARVLLLAHIPSFQPSLKVFPTSSSALVQHTPPSSRMSGFQALFPSPFSLPCHVWLMDYMWLVSCWVNSNPSRAFGVTLPSLAAFATPSSVQSSANIINLLFTFAFRSLIKTLNKPGMLCFFSNFF